MATEIERTWLVTGDAWRAAATESTRIAQGYLASGPDRSVRVRLRDGRAVLTVKMGAEAIERTEVEVAIDEAAARQLLGSPVIVGAVLDKTRHLVPIADGLTAEVDEFHGANAGLVLVEVELPARDTPVPTMPWFGDEVTDDPRYLNANLAVQPFAADTG